MTQSYIPTPDAAASSINYDSLYSKRFSQPATYVRFSATVEECVGSSYCMDEDDQAALKIMNQKRAAGKKISENVFEEVMSFFEDTANDKHKYAWVDGAPILSFDDLSNDPSFRESVSEPARAFAEDIYEHWSGRRMKSANRHVQPSLKVSNFKGHGKVQLA